MSSLAAVIELVGPVPAPDWGAWEPLALTLLTSGAAALALLCLLRLAGRGQRLARALSLAALAAGLAGQAALFVSLEQPLRAYEFYLHPSTSSWTAAGAYLVPLFLACAALVAVRARGRARGKAGLGRGLCALALLPAAGVFVYAANEIMACVGRALWTGPLTPPIFLVAGLAGAAGLAAMLAARLEPHGPGSPAATLAGLSALGAACCALLALLLPAPEGFGQGTTLWWHAPELLCLLLAVAAFAGWRNPARLAPAAGAAGLLGALLLYWKLIHMGQAFARTASTVADRAALLDLVSWPSLLAAAGAAGLLLALAALLPVLLPEHP